MTDKKKRKFKKVRLTEISIVDIPAEPNSMISIFKRAETPATKEGVMPNSMPDIGKLVEDMAKATTTIDDLTARLAKADERAEAAEAKTVAVSKAVEAADDGEDGDPILKAADPIVAAEIIKLRKSNAAAMKMLAKADEAQEIKKAAGVCARDFSNLPLKPDEFAPIYKRAMGKLDEEDAAEFNRILKAADAALEAQTQALGYSGIMAKSGAEEALEAKANAIAKDTNVTFEKAYVRATELHPDLYRQFLVERGESN